MTHEQICLTCRYAACSGKCVCVAQPEQPKPVPPPTCFYDFFRTRAAEAELIAQGVPTNRKPANEPGGCGC